jgi:L-ascorbate metabolism protein UlaG (beta-lactamase superfamily)
MRTWLPIAALAGVLASGSALAAGKTELMWYGHSAFKITTPAGKVLLIDPWIANPANQNGAAEVEKLAKVDLILLTHGHADHVGNTVEIAKKTGAKLVATFDLAKAMVKYKGYPEKQAGFDSIGHFGGEIALLDGEVKVAFITAVHGGDLESGEGMPSAGLPVAAGDAGGFLVSVKDGPAIYHAGDTDVFADMAFVRQFRPVDVFIAPIGDKFTMGPSRAALATRIVEPTKLVIPMHYGTFPVLTGTPAAFDQALKTQKVSVPMREMKVGETLSF